MPEALRYRHGYLGCGSPKPQDLRLRRADHALVEVGDQLRRVGVTMGFQDPSPSPLTLGPGRPHVISGGTGGRCRRGRREVVALPGRWGCGGRGVAAPGWGRRRSRSAFLAQPGQQVVIDLAADGEATGALVYLPGRVGGRRPSAAVERAGIETNGAQPALHLTHLGEDERSSGRAPLGPRLPYLDRRWRRGHRRRCLGHRRSSHRGVVGRAGHRRHFAGRVARRERALRRPVHQEGDQSADGDRACTDAERPQGAVGRAQPEPAAVGF